MATYTTVAELKEHLNIELDFTEDDNYLQSLLNVSELAVANFCNGGINEVIEIPATIKQAYLFLAAHYYLNRTPIAFTSTSELPYTFQFLLNPYKDFVVC